jgi:hypothetical protein
MNHFIFDKNIKGWNIHSDDLKIENGKNNVLFYIFRKGKIVFVKNNS